MAIFMVGLFFTAIAVAIAYTLTMNSPLGIGKRLSQGHQMLDRTLEALRSCIGTDNLEVQPNNSAQEFLSTLTAIVGALVPATLMGICFIKMFSLQPFIWRKRAAWPVRRTRSTTQERMPEVRMRSWLYGFTTDWRI